MIDDRSDHSLAFEMLSALTLPDEEMLSAPASSILWSDVLLGQDAFLIGIILLLVVFLVMLGKEINRSVVVTWDRK